MDSEDDTDIIKDTRDVIRSKFPSASVEQYNNFVERGLAVSNANFTLREQSDENNPIHITIDNDAKTGIPANQACQLYQSENCGCTEVLEIADRYLGPAISDEDCLEPTPGFNPNFAPSCLQRDFSSASLESDHDDDSGSTFFRNNRHAPKERDIAGPASCPPSPFPCHNNDNTEASGVPKRSLSEKSIEIQTLINPKPSTPHETHQQPPVYADQGDHVLQKSRATLSKSQQHSRPAVHTEQKSETESQQSSVPADHVQHGSRTSIPSDGGSCFETHHPLPPTQSVHASSKREFEMYACYFKDGSVPVAIIVEVQAGVRTPLSVETLEKARMLAGIPVQANWIFHSFEEFKGFLKLEYGVKYTGSPEKQQMHSELPASPNILHNTNLEAQDYWSSVGEAVAGFLKPLGIDVDVDVERNGERSMCVESEIKKKQREDVQKEKEKTSDETQQTTERQLPGADICGRTNTISNSERVLGFVNKHNDVNNILAVIRQFHNQMDCMKSYAAYLDSFVPAVMQRSCMEGEPSSTEEAGVPWQSHTSQTTRARPTQESNYAPGSSGIDFMGEANIENVIHSLEDSVINQREQPGRNRAVEDEMCDQKADAAVHGKRVPALPSKTSDDTGLRFHGTANIGNVITEGRNITINQNQVGNSSFKRSLSAQDGRDYPGRQRGAGRGRGSYFESSISGPGMRSGTRSDLLTDRLYGPTSENTHRMTSDRHENMATQTHRMQEPLNEPFYGSYQREPHETPSYAPSQWSGIHYDSGIGGSTGGTSHSFPKEVYMPGMRPRRWLSNDTPLQGDAVNRYLVQRHDQRPWTRNPPTQHMGLPNLDELQQLQQLHTGYGEMRRLQRIVPEMPFHTEAEAEKKSQTLRRRNTGQESAFVEPVGCLAKSSPTAQDMRLMHQDELVRNSEHGVLHFPGYIPGYERNAPYMHHHTDSAVRNSSRRFGPSGIPRQSQQLSAVELGQAGLHAPRSPPNPEDLRRLWTTGRVVMPGESIHETTPRRTNKRDPDPDSENDSFHSLDSPVEDLEDSGIGLVPQAEEASGIHGLVPVDNLSARPDTSYRDFFHSLQFDWLHQILFVFILILLSIYGAVGYAAI